jgi:hypothetical protein
VIDHVGPYFVLLYRAMEKLDLITVRGTRGIQVNNISALINTFNNYEDVCKVGSELNFWGFSSFSTKDTVATDTAFLGLHTSDAIAYACGALTCVSITPLSVMQRDEGEILPLPPAMFKVQSAVKIGKKLVISVEQISNEDQCYVIPRK